MRPLQSSLRSLHAELGRPKNMLAIRRQLRVGNMISWQVHRIVSADSPVSAARHYPLPQATALLLEAAARAGVSREVLADIREAAEGFRGFMREQANDRAGFDTLIAGIGQGDEGPIEIPHRRAAFRAESHIWGFQRDVSAMTALVRRSATGSGFDVAMLMSQFGYRRLRAGASATVFAFGAAENWGSSMRPLDTSAMKTHHSPLVPDFCSDPMPSLECVAVPSGQVVYRLADGSLGRCGSKDLTTGVFVSGDEPVRIGDTSAFELNHVLHCPTRRLVMSLFLDEDSFADAVPSVLTRLAGVNGSDEQPLPLSERVLPLGPADRVTECKGVPSYVEMVRYLANRTGWFLGQFKGFQMTIDFPVFASSMSLYVPVG